MSGIPRGLLGQPLDEVELGVLRWVAQGFTGDEIRKAMRLSSVEKAKYHLQRIYRKLGAINAAHATFLGIQAGWLDPATGNPNTHAVPAIAADLVRNKVMEVMDETRERLVAEAQEQLRTYCDQLAITLTERGA